MCQGLGPKKHDEISEIDRTFVYHIVMLLGFLFNYLIMSCLFSS